ncbi:alcohol oxidase [Lyophyllum atratum]|nr:alcohol oxidase [Lyophyllum atratum]
MLPLILFSSLIVAAHAALTACPSPTDADYDFIVVGSGAGGGPLAARLAESGFSVLLVDAGHEVVNFNTTLPGYSLRSLEDEPPSYSGEYPRARALGGSTLYTKVHNAMINILAGTRQDFDGLAATFSDQSWSRDNMQDYFRRIENNQYLPPLLAPDHGFDGWLKTTTLPLDVILTNPLSLDPQLAALVASLPLAGLPILDLNSIAEDGSSGVTSPSATVDKNHIRSSVHERLRDVQNSSSGRLRMSLDTLATKLLLCNSDQGISAYGVQIAPGAALPVANNFAGKITLNLQNITARHEVIVSAGTFQSPQLLMLSGIGDEEHLRQYGIEPTVNLPGVGTNLQDHDEISVIWRMKNNYTILSGCKFLSDPDQDPCLRNWLESNHENIYAFSGVIDAVITQSSPNLPAPDVLTYFSPVSFPGFFRGAPQQVADNHNALTAVVLKGHPSSKGTVRLTGPHPQDPLEIEKLLFQAPDGPADVAALRDGIRRARDIVTHSPLGFFVDTEVSPGPNTNTDEEIDDYIFNRVFAVFHPLKRKIGCFTDLPPLLDPSAVLDGNFKISEKAADVIIAAAKARIAQ